MKAINKIVGVLKHSWFVKEIILVGSFSRGEGCIIKTNGTKRILSDYDFWIITKIPLLFSGRKQEYWKKLLGKDYSFVEENFLRAGKLLSTTTTEYIDAKKYGKVLYGCGKEFQSIIRDVGNIPTLENGLNILINKIPHLFLADVLYESGDELSAINELMKVVIACGDFHIIKARQYDSLLSKRKPLIKNILSGGHELTKLYDLAVDFRNGIIDKVEYKSLSRQIRRIVWGVIEDINLEEIIQTKSLRIRCTFPIKFEVGLANWLKCFMSYQKLKEARIKASINLINPITKDILDAKRILVKPIYWKSLCLTKNSKEDVRALGKLIYDMKVAGA